MSKSYRLVEIAREVFAESGEMEIELLDLFASEYGRHIHPCKACFSTAAALCHWPCSCYPNHSLGQIHDWMNEIYPMWVAAHGIMIVTPVNWYQVSSPLKLMMDRLVCADGGNPDPTRTQGKNAKLAKQIEIDGWDYPRHLAGRLFAVVVHGDGPAPNSTATLGTGSRMPPATPARYGHRDSGRSAQCGACPARRTESSNLSGQRTEPSPDNERYRIFVLSSMEMNCLLVHLQMFLDNLGDVGTEALARRDPILWETSRRIKKPAASAPRGPRAASRGLWYLLASRPKAWGYGGSP
jgi:multimeric flavodoxin WrbA